jgi:hypothetical protein
VTTHREFWELDTVACRTVDSSRERNKTFIPKPSSTIAEDLKAVNMVGGLAIVAAVFAAFLPDLLDIHSRIPHYTALWLGVALATTFTMVTPKVYRDAAHARKTVVIKLVGVGASFLATALLFAGLVLTK